MKFILIAVAISLCCVYGEEEYHSRYDKINIDEVLQNKRLLNGYMRCTLDLGPCTPEGKDLKYYITDALKNGCEKCNEQHRKSIKKVMAHLIKNEPQFWKQAVNKYDPDQVYTQMYEKEIESW